MIDIIFEVVVVCVVIVHIWYIRKAIKKVDSHIDMLDNHMNKLDEHLDYIKWGSK